jgi:hypothetical protein
MGQLKIHEPVHLCDVGTVLLALGVRKRGAWCWAVITSVRGTSGHDFSVDWTRGLFPRAGFGIHFLFHSCQTLMSVHWLLLDDVYSCTLPLLWITYVTFPSIETITVSDEKLTHTWWIGKDLEGSDRALILVLSLHLSRWSKIMRNVTQHSRYVSQPRFEPSVTFRPACSTRCPFAHAQLETAVSSTHPYANRWTFASWSITPGHQLFGLFEDILPTIRFKWAGQDDAPPRVCRIHVTSYGSIILPPISLLLVIAVKRDAAQRTRAV